MNFDLRKNLLKLLETKIGLNKNQLLKHDQFLQLLGMGYIKILIKLVEFSMTSIATITVRYILYSTGLCLIARKDDSPAKRTGKGGGQ